MNTLPLEVLQKVKTEVERNACPEHGEHPTVTFAPDGYNVSSCCKRFEKDMVELIAKTMGEYYNNMIIGTIKGRR